MHQSLSSISLRSTVVIMVWLIAVPVLALDQPDCPSLERRAAGVDEVRQEAMTQDQTLETLKRELERVPMSHEGSCILDRLNRHPLLDKVSRQEATEFHNAVMRKRMLIRATMQQRSQQ